MIDFLEEKKLFQKNVFFVFSMKKIVFFVFSKKLVDFIEFFFYRKLKITENDTFYYGSLTCFINMCKNTKKLEQREYYITSLASVKRWDALFVSEEVLWIRFCFNLHQSVEIVFEVLCSPDLSLFEACL